MPVAAILPAIASFAASAGGGATIAGIGAAAGAGISALSQSRTNAANAQMAADANAQNRENFQNRHQWEVQDLQKAGLNPILSAQTQPPGLPQAQYATQQNIAPNLQNLAPQIVQSAQLLNSMNLTNEQAKTEKTKQIVNAADATLKSSQNLINMANAKQANLDAIQRERVGGFEKNWLYKYVGTPFDMLFKSLGNIFHSNASIMAPRN